MSAKLQDDLVQEVDEAFADQVHKISMILAQEAAVMEVDEAIVHDPHLMNERDQRKKALWVQRYHEFYKILMEQYQFFRALPELMLPFFENASKERKDNFAEDCKRLLKLSDYLKQDDTDSQTFQEFSKFSNDSLEWFYEIAKEYIDQKRFEDAMVFLRTINLINPYFSESWLSLGYCLKEKQSYELALEALAMAITLNTSNPWPRLLSADCYLHLKSQEDVKIELQEAEKLLQEQEDPKKYEDYLLQLKSRARGVK